MTSFIFQWVKYHPASVRLVPFWQQLLAGFVLFGLVVLEGCSGAKVVVHKNVQEGAYPLAVAVLPFTLESKLDKTEADAPADMLRRVFYAHFSYLGYSDLPLAEVDRRLKKSGYTDPESFANLPIAELRELLGADAVVKGHLINHSNFTGGIYAETWIKAKLSMVDLRTGLTLWETEHEELDQSSIISPTVVNMVRQQIENADTEHAYHKVAEEFALQVVKEVPDPAAPRASEIKLPKIRSMHAELPGKPSLAPGDLIRVRLVGDPDMKASFDIGGWKSRLPLREVAPGDYRGEYRIGDNDQVADALLIGRLEDHVGLTAKKVFKGAVVTIAASPLLARRNTHDANARSSQ